MAAYAAAAVAVSAQDHDEDAYKFRFKPKSQFVVDAEKQRLDAERIGDESQYREKFYEAARSSQQDTQTPLEKPVRNQQQMETSRKGGAFRTAALTMKDGTPHRVRDSSRFPVVRRSLSNDRDAKQDAIRSSDRSVSWSDARGSTLHNDDDDATNTNPRDTSLYDTHRRHSVPIRGRHDSAADHNGKLTTVSRTAAYDEQIDLDDTAYNCKRHSHAAVEKLYTSPEYVAASSSPLTKTHAFRRLTRCWSRSAASSHGAHDSERDVPAEHMHRSVSTWMKDSSQRSTASHKIPKTGAGYKRVNDCGKQVLTSEALGMPRNMIHPFHPRYRAFLMVTVFMAATTGFVTPWIVAFQSVPGLCPYKDFAAMFEYLAFAVFFVDICLSFNTAYYDQEILITDRGDIARHYLRFRFWFDIIALLPFDYAIIEGIWPPCFTSHTARYVSLLKLLRLLRMYRVLLFFKVLEYNLAIGLMFSTMVRNLVYVLYTCHWAGCAFYFIARQENLTQGTWLGMYPDLITSWPTKFDAYVFSLYWAVTTVATVGYGDFHAASIPEAIFTLIYMLFIIGLNAFIIGTLTLVVMKNDERTGQYRQRASNLKQYSSVNGIKPILRQEMQEHLRLHFNNEEAADEQVLGIYPPTIRRRILRFLYLEVLQQCYLFRDSRIKYLDALLAVAKIELFMPKSEVFSEGDHVNELAIVVGGVLEVAPSVDYVSTTRGDDVSVRGGKNGRGSKPSQTFRPSGRFMSRQQPPEDADRTTTIDVASRRMLGPGAVVGEVAFFTEVPQPETIRSVTVAKVLTVSRRHYADVSASFPIGARAALECLLERAEHVVQRDLEAAGGLAILKTLPEAIAFKWSTPEGGNAAQGPRDMHLNRISTLDRHSMAVAESALLQSGLSEQQERVVGNILRIRTLILQFVAKDDEAKTTDFLYAATKDDVDKVRQMLRQGFAVDSCDYDNRTALMLASAKGHADVVASLLAAGSDPQLADNLGGTALLEACKAGNDNIVALLRKNGAEFNMGRMDAASLLCKLVFDSNVPLLRRMIQAGIATDFSDYDGRTALHVAASEGNLTAVKLLVEEGHADIMLKDRWGHTALDDAGRLGPSLVTEYLQGVQAALLALQQL